MPEQIEPQVASENLWLMGIEFALRSFMANIDYDHHKYLECDELDGSDSYPDLAVQFDKDLNYFLSK